MSKKAEVPDINSKTKLSFSSPNQPNTVPYLPSRIPTRQKLNSTTPETKRLYFTILE
jgi:hypothetical protein